MGGGAGLDVHPQLLTGVVGQPLGGLAQVVVGGVGVGHEAAAGVDADAGADGQVGQVILLVHRAEQNAQVGHVVEHHDGGAVALGLGDGVQRLGVADGVHLAVEAHLLAQIAGDHVGDHVGVAAGGGGADDHADTLALQAALAGGGTAGRLGAGIAGGGSAGFRVRGGAAAAGQQADCHGGGKKQSGQFLELHCSIPSFHSVHTLGMFRACLRGMGALHYRGTMIAGRSMGFPFAKGNEMGEQICKLCVGFRKMNLRFQKYPFCVSNMEDLFRLEL